MVSSEVTRGSPPSPQALSSVSSLDVPFFLLDTLDT